MSEWSHLPNARHIDWVIESVRAQPQAWDVAWDVARGAAGNAAMDAARDAGWYAGWYAAWAAAGAARWDAAGEAAWDAARGAAWGAARDAAWGAVGALVAFDYAGDILDMPVPAVRLLAASGDPAAILLLPAVIVRHGGTDE